MDSEVYFRQANGSACRDSYREIKGRGTAFIVIQPD